MGAELCRKDTHPRALPATRLGARRPARQPESLSDSLVVSRGACATFSPATGRAARANISPLEPSGPSGSVTFTEVKSEFGRIALQVDVDLQGLEAGSVHGINVLESGPDSKPYNPESLPHGDPFRVTRFGTTSAKMGKGLVLFRHIGDMGNVTADGEGRAGATYRDPLMLLDAKVAYGGLGKKDTESAVVGHTVVVFEGEDDTTTQPLGGSGAPIAFGDIAWTGQ